MTARVYCAVLLCLSGCLSSGSAEDGENRYYAEKPGVCPNRRHEADVCTWIRFLPCTDDSDCANNEKCCSNGCGLQCMAPVTEKPGVCPSRHFEAEVCTWLRFVSCADDSDCVKNEKCCSNGCGLQCMVPVTGRPKTQCEQHRDSLQSDNGVVPLLGAFLPECDEEGQYKSQQCHGSTGYCWCVDSTGQERAGTRTSPGTPRVNCDKPENPGVCPSSYYEAEVCTWLRFVTCADDSDCANNEKCCSNGCGLQCMTPVTGRPKTQCEQHRDSLQSGNDVVPRLGAFIPECDEQGQYKPQQCHGSTGYCWCVDSMGQERAGTRTPPGTSRVNCDKPEKPGVCPSSYYEAEVCTWIRFVTCADDSDCASNEKCCSNGCGLQCMAPVTEKPGVCPSRRFETEVCTWLRFVTCADDSDCADNEKCCSNGCGLQCMNVVDSPVTGRPKTQCEQHRDSLQSGNGVVPLLGAFIPECDEQGQYKSQQCHGSTGYCWCVDSTGQERAGTRTPPGTPRVNCDEPEKPGVCPIRHYGADVCTWIRFMSCANDSDCANIEKCCSNGCGFQCMAPVKGITSKKTFTKPGVCPSRHYDAAMCAVITFRSCAEDSDCANNEKCCSNGCGFQCTAPVTGRPKTQCEQHRDSLLSEDGLLPPVGAFIPECDEQGQYKRQQCHGSTGYCWCVDSMGQERAGTRTSPGTPRVNCDEPEKPEMCPSRRYVAEMCTGVQFVSCVDDSECANNEKCCHNGCGLQCMAPVTGTFTKPGVCPSRRYSAAMCARIRFRICADDNDCANNDKCCHNGCALQCMAPVTVMPGACSSRRYTEMECAQIRFVSCANDGDCARNERCCNNGCGLQCMAPITVLVYH